MRGIFGLCFFVGIAIVLSVSNTLAQSGVFSGPPQVQPGQDGPGQDLGPRPGQDLGPRPGQDFGPRPGQDFGPRPEPRPGPEFRPGPGLPGPSQGPYAPGGQQGLTWIAVVGGFDGTGRRVSVGYSGFQRSRFEAEEAAIRACNGKDRSVACRNPFAVSNGCLYIVPGNKSGGGVRWGRGASHEAAIQECRRGGYNCPQGKLIGGCVPPEHR